MTITDSFLSEAWRPVTIALVLVVCFVSIAIFCVKKTQNNMSVRQHQVVPARSRLYAGYTWSDKEQLFNAIRQAQAKSPTEGADLQELIDAVRTANARELAQQLVYGCKPTRFSKKDKNTLLMEAVRYTHGDGGNTDKLVELLLVADPNLANKVDLHGNTALHFVPDGNWSIAKMLERFGAKWVENADGKKPKLYVQMRSVSSAILVLCPVHVWLLSR